MDNIGNNNRESKIRNKKSVLRRTVDNYLDIMDKLYFTNKKRTDNFKINSQSNSNNALIITLFDTHYGEEIKKDGVIKYNFDIADKRIRKYIKDVIKYYLDNKDSIDEIYLVLGGDNIDGDGTVYPHHIQEIEEGFNKQIDRYIKIITEVIEHFRVDRIIKQDGYNETIYYLFNDTEYTDLKDLVSAIYLQEITDYYEKYNNARAEWEEANNRWHKYVQDKQDEYNKTVGG